ncbi:maltose alpha-D-glucosyltransferase [Flaviaesturariibacter flavus]|uniref:maltose alpha-D-glucosyltransferase n=1 Tax=Flaviaesturariibacter flavus TaxID=2502780 RepID=A0A4R1BP13_9BACT|nr:maltose alpha-D-glucosyltransferase [Flaviaesturariibacter flavus]TCJ19066.1 maltose alpha-D-glucosyltransferase [Flaviaesturariibacter flavus]
MATLTNKSEDLLWYKDAVIYELHIKAFRDADGDGIGDFKGLIEKLDYLQELGATAVWVLPFYPSPLRDDGYDIADYYSINPRYGDLEQFKAFLDEAHRRGLRVITELVVNHTSDQHPWFQRARRAPKGSPERDYYVWSDDPTQYKDVRIIFQDFEASNWTWDPVAQQYYWHRFFHHQPDLNFDNPQVQQEIFNVMDYWCAMGVDGFRLDAIPYLFEREGTNGENLPETHEFLKRLRKHVDEKFPGTLFLAEANMWPEEAAAYFGNGDECHMNYHFPVMPRMFMAVQQEDRYPITDIFEQTPPIPENCQWAMFLRNHDELTLEMVTDEERDFMYKAYAKDPKARINLGIRHRLAPLMDNNRRKIELMNSLLFSLPGTPVLYYGDEIGMGDNFYLGDRDGVRTPMQWSSDRNAGFSDCNPHQLYLPVILDPEYHYEAVNVELQRRNTSSLFWFMKRLIALRRNFKAFSRGDMQFLNVENPKVLAFTRTFEDQTVLVIVNLSKYAQPAEVDLRTFRGYQPVELFSRNKFPAVREDAPYFFTMGPHSFQWFQLEKVRSRVEEDRSIPMLELLQDSEPLSAFVRTQLEQDVLPTYVFSRPWFAGKDRTVYSLNIAEQQRMGNGYPSWWMLLEVNYESGLPEWYQLAVAVVPEERAQELAATYPESIIAHVNTPEGPAMLCDAFYLKELQRALLRRLVTGEHKELPTGNVYFDAVEELSNYDYENATPRVFAQNKFNTSVVYDNRLFVKWYRKVEFFVNPDVELNRYLSLEAGFPHTPRFLGSVEWQGARGRMVLAIAQELVDNHGNAYDFLQERVHNFIERIIARNNSEELLRYEPATWASPRAYEELPEALRDLVGSRAAELMRQLGDRTAQMHKAFARNTLSRDFAPEEFSLHYQRSLFASMVSLVRDTYHKMNRAEGLDEPAAVQIRELGARRGELLSLLKRIYDHKLDILKIRTHGAFDLQKVLLTGKDLVLYDFGGNIQKSYSERRIKRSPLRDVAQMVAGIYEATFAAFSANSHFPGEREQFLPYAERWAYLLSGFFLHAYFDCVNGDGFVPKDENDAAMVLQTFLVERSLRHLGQHLAGATGRVDAPLAIIRSVFEQADVPVGEA